MNEDDEVYWPVGEFPEVALDYFEAQEILQLRAEVARLEDRLNDVQEHAELLALQRDTARAERDTARVAASDGVL